MTPQTLTVISGIVLLLVFALVGWYVRNRRSVRDRKSRDADQNGGAGSGTP